MALLRDITYVVLLRIVFLVFPPYRVTKTQPIFLLVFGKAVFKIRFLK